MGVLLTATFKLYIYIYTSINTFSHMFYNKNKSERPQKPQTALNPSRALSRSSH